MWITLGTGSQAADPIHTYRAAPFVLFSNPRPIGYLSLLWLSACATQNVPSDLRYQEKIRWKATVITRRAPHLSRTRTGCDLGFPCRQLRRSGIVSLECSPGAGQVLHPVLCEPDHAEIRNRRQTGRISLRTDFHAGERFWMTGSSVGGSFRMWWSQECHSGGTCEAWYSCCVKCQMC